MDLHYSLPTKPVPGTKVRDFMTTDVVSARPEMPLGTVSRLLIKYGLSGLPVLGGEGELLGIVTEYDLISKGSLIHIPTFLKLLHDFRLYRKDRAFVGGELKSLLSLTVKDVMNREPLVIGPDAPIEEAVKVFSEHHRVNPIPVVDENRRVVGVLSRFDIMKLYMPATVASVSKRGAVPAESQVEGFLRDFERQFVFVRKSRTRAWLITSIIFLLIGFLAALFFALRVSIRLSF